MNFSQGKLADSLVEEMLELIHKYVKRFTQQPQSVVWN